MTKPRALITGICGQDGAYLASFLWAKGYSISGLDLPDRNFPNFPATLEQMAATMIFHQFDQEQWIDLGDGVRVQARTLNHPNGAYGYRLDYQDHSIAYCTDTEHREAPDANVLAGMYLAGLLHG